MFVLTMKCVTISFIAFLACIESSDSLRILAVYSLPSRSNALLGESLVGHLAKAGHEVTHITAFPPKKVNPNVTIVDVSYNREVFKEDVNLKSILENPVQEDIKSLLLTMIDLSNITVTNPNVINLLNDQYQHFDLVIVEWLFNEIYAGFAAVYECPLIWFSTVEPHWMILKIVDGLPNPAYTADILSDSVPPFSMRQRALELWNQIWGIFLHTIYFWRAEYDVYVKLFEPIMSNRGRELNEYRDLMYNASLVLSNSHVSLGLPMTLPQNFISLGGFHIDDDLKPFSEDLKTVMDNSVHGIIYFSMGSTLKSRDMPEQIIKDLVKLFGKLKETVIWKYEQHLPNRPPNVHILPWAPQHNILAHESCVLFITHGGLLSITEAVHFSVPIIGVPIFRDQYINVNRAVAKGFAQRVLFSHSFADDLDKAIRKARISSRFQRKVNELSRIYHDRLVPPSKELVHWVEHVAKTGGAMHLRPPALMVTWNHRYYLDIIFIIGCICCVVYNEFVKRIISKFSKKEKTE